MKTIYEFKKGDKIVRVQPAKPYSDERINIFGQKEGGIRDRSYLGEMLIFVGIANGCVYLQRADKLSITIFGHSMIVLALDIWDEGWDLYFDPINLLDGIEPKLDSKTIEQQIQDAIECENYELAEILKQKLK